MHIVGGWWGLLCVFLLGPACVQQPTETARITTRGEVAAVSARPQTAAERAMVAARQAMASAQWAQAVQVLRRAAADLQTVADYGWYTLGTAAAKAQDWPAARQAFTTVVEQFSKSPFVGHALDGAIRAALAQNDLSAAERLLTQRDALPAHGAAARVVERQQALRRAELTWRRGDAASARNQLLALYRNATLLSDARAVRLRWRTLQHGDPLATLGAETRIALAQSLLARDMPSEAVLAVRGVAGDAAETVLADALFAARAYPKAIVVLQRVVARAPTLELRQKLGSAAVRGQQFDLALQVQRDIARDYAGTADGRDAEYKRAFILFDAGRFADARTAYSGWIAANPQSSLVDAARWRIFWSNYLLHDWPGALAALDAVGSGPRTTYWRARVQEQRGSRAEARALYQDVVGTEFYGTLANARLHGGAAAVAQLFVAPAARAHDPALPIPDTARAQALQRLGAWDVALDEYDQTGGSVDRFGPSHDWALAQWGAEWGVAPVVSRALMQQESAFRPQIVSPAGAVGLMQLMPRTAATMARQMGLADYHELDLYRPVPNMRLGLWYLRTLLQRYHQQLPYVLASYNAGEAAVDRWRAQLPLRELDEFIELIPYRETNTYVRKILSNIW